MWFYVQPDSLWPLVLPQLAELLWGLWQSFWNPVSHVAIPQGTWAGLSRMETFTGLVNACSPGLAWVLKHFLGLCTWGISSTYILERCCKFMQFLMHFPTLSVPLHLQMCIKPAQKTIMAKSTEAIWIPALMSILTETGPSVLKS